MLTGVVVDPVSPTMNSLTDPRYQAPVYVEANWPAGHGTIPEEENGFEVVRSVSPCSRIRVATDVCNIGGSETTVHEYVVKQIRPRNVQLGTFMFRKQLPHEKRETMEFYFPPPSTDPSVEIADGDYEFEVEVLGTTQKKKRRVRVCISENRLEIACKELDC